MNKFITAIKNLDVAAVKESLKEPKWRSWSEPSGKNALHYLCGLGPSVDPVRTLSILKLLLKSGMDIDSVHRIDEKEGFFPATPLWYAYTRGRNESLYNYLLKSGADPSNCWWAIAWYDDVDAANLWLRHDAQIDKEPSLDDLFLGAFQWKKYAFARWTLDLGADVNAPGPRGLTALMLAVKRKDEDSIGWLIDAGADPDLESEQGISARKIAEEEGPKRLLKLFTATSI
jgi:ankyrin repeat protein